MSKNVCVGAVHFHDFSQWGIISPWSWPGLSVVIAAGRRLRLWHTSCGPLVPSRPPSLTNSVTQTHAKQAAVSAAPRIELQMSPLWVPALFDVMNNEGGLSFKQLAENCNAWLFWFLTCSSPVHKQVKLHARLPSSASYLFMSTHKAVKTSPAYLLETEEMRCVM